MSLRGLFYVALHPEEAAGGRFCRLLCIRRELPVAGLVGAAMFQIFSRILIECSTNSWSFSGSTPEVRYSNRISRDFEPCL